MFCPICHSALTSPWILQATNHIFRLATPHHSPNWSVLQNDFPNQNDYRKKYRNFCRNDSTRKLWLRNNIFRLATQNSKINIKKLISQLLKRPQGSQGCQKIRQGPLSTPFEVWCAKIALKLKNIQKSQRKQGFFDLFFNFDDFRSLCLFGAILAQELNSFICKKNMIFWHPWDPWGRVNSGKKIFWVQTATVRCAP